MSEEITRFCLAYAASGVVTVILCGADIHVNQNKKPQRTLTHAQAVRLALFLGVIWPVTALYLLIEYGKDLGK